MAQVSSLKGIVVCGGESSRMGRDKSQLNYHGKSQCYWVYELLNLFCGTVVISCNKSQFAQFANGYLIQPDLEQLENIGPMAALLTAFSNNPNLDLLILGCDYPFLDATHFQLFLENTQKDSLASVFYNQEGKYEPLIGWYSRACGPLLESFFQRGSYSLQDFLKSVNAEKYVPDDPIVMTSVDTPKQFLEVQLLLKNKNL